MKKFMLSAAVIAALLPAAANAQEATVSNIDTKELRFGVYIAPTISWMRPTANKSNDGSYESASEGSKVGFTYGVMAEYNFADNYAFVTGLQVNMTGGKIESKNVGGIATDKNTVNTASFNYNLTYLEVPLALKMRTDPISGFRFFGQLGITTGFNIAKKARYNVDYYDYQSGTNKESIADKKEKLKGTLATSPVLFQMNIGAGAEYPINNKLAAYAGIFFNNGFAPDATNPNKYDLPYQASFRDGNTRLNNFAIRVGLFF